MAYHIIDRKELIMKIRKDKIVKAIVEKTYPDYKGRKFFLDNSGKVSLYDTNWCGGTKNYYMFVPMTSNKKAEMLPQFAPWSNPTEGETIEIPENILCVKRSYFCGKECGLTIYAHPNNVVKMFPKINLDIENQVN